MKDINDLKEVKEVKVEDNVKEKEGLFATDADYDSGWRYDTNGKTHTVLFNHNLGCIPTRIVLLFTADKQTVYPVIWQHDWTSKYIEGSPPNIKMDNKKIQLETYQYLPLHTERPFMYTSGYWRVFAWK